MILDQLDGYCRLFFGSLALGGIYVDFLNQTSPKDPLNRDVVTRLIERRHGAPWDTSKA
jgi:hypothetical protein